MKTRLFIVLFITSLLMVGCKPSEHENALSLIDQTRQFISNNDDNSALVMIDSIHTAYPRDIAVRRMADTLKWNIELRQTERSLPHIDSMLIVLNDSISKLTKRFKYIKNEDYQDFGSFEHRLLRTENNANRCYLKPSTTEKGEFSITSYYVGTKAEHNRFKVTVNDVSIETQPASDVNISQFMDVDTYHEILMFDFETMNGVEQFIYNNKDNRTKVTLLGGKQPYIYYLGKNEKDIFAKTYELSVALSDFYKLTDQQLRMTQKVEILKKRLNID